MILAPSPKCTSSACDHAQTTRYSRLKLEEYPILDIALSDGNTITPLNLVMDVIDGGYCGNITTLTEGVYVPVIHKYNWESVPPKGLSRGEKAPWR